MDEIEIIEFNIRQAKNDGAITRLQEIDALVIVMASELENELEYPKGMNA